MSNNSTSELVSDSRRLLHNFNPGGAAEHEFSRRMVELCSLQENAFSKFHYTPGHFTASAFVLSPDRHKVLLIAHSKLKRWLQPGGHVDPTDPTLEAAARREVAEETRIEHLELLQKEIFDLDIHSIPPHKDAPAHEHFDVRFLFAAPTLSARAASDANDVQWVRLAEVSAIESDASVMRAISKILVKQPA